ncbi:hypothetical protein BME96_12430 [Virgibacillus halodenitrificans]|uniref:Uncharacterized protein n=1 Tax=Virgibacillus halodenitrificans TaxID=1482 RepID=A0AAC9J1H8_VIRHA|nr:hypothetical protein [Virgibacillus halodenitrificans]APC48949.1 hypothetical protein BME96_12430 [Virgibacillus halodenitrificans]MYL56325.1 hypothetical protein [Virgibacillus halodenitrificans]
MTQEAKEMENGERLAKLEQQTDNIERIVTELNDNIKSFTAIYVPRTEIQLMLDARDKQISDLDKKLESKADSDEVKRIVKEDDNRKNNAPAWAAVMISAVVFLYTVLTALI